MLERGASSEDLARRLNMPLDHVRYRLFKLRQAGLVEPASAAPDPAPGPRRSPACSPRSSAASFRGRLAMEPLKIVVSGPVGSGKSTFVRTLSETKVVDNDALTGEATGKDFTTASLDYGAPHLDGQMR